MHSIGVIDNSSNNALLGTEATNLVSPFRGPGQEATDIASIRGLRSLWAQTLGDPRICVAVLDGPIDRSHPCFAGAELYELRTQRTGRAKLGSAIIHGTHVTSAIFAQHRGPLKGIAPSCRGLIVPIFRDVEGGSFSACSQRDLALAIMKAADAGAHIINISGGVLSTSDMAATDRFLKNAVRYCAENGVLIVAAAGNDGCDCLHVPSALPSVLAVGAMSSRGIPLDSSNWGERFQTQGIVAPGEKIPGAVPGGGISMGTGTSYATAVVSGVAALLLSLQLKQGEKPDPHAVRRIILKSAVGCDGEVNLNCRRLLVGRLNIKDAMRRLIGWEDAISESIASENIKSFLSGNLSASSSVVDSHDQGLQMAGTDSVGDDMAVAKSKLNGKCEGNKNSGGVDSMNEHLNEVASLSGSGSGSGCECTASDDDGAAQCVFAIGSIGYDFVTQDREDSIQQAMKMHLMRLGETDPQPDPNDHEQFASYLKDNLWDAESVVWTLSDFEGRPIYAIAPKCAFAAEAYERLRILLEKQVSGEIERISIAGHITSRQQLSSCDSVDVIRPIIRGIFGWSTEALVNYLIPDNDQAKGILQEFLRYAYAELCNLGLSVEDRILNFTLTGARALAEIFEEAQLKGLDFSAFEIEPSQSCLKSPNRMDITLFFERTLSLNRDALFRMREPFASVGRPVTPMPQFRFAVDATNCVPVQVGIVRSYFLPGSTEGIAAAKQSPE